jgi:hypothetical protein
LRRLSGASVSAMSASSGLTRNKSLKGMLEC